MYDKRFDGLSAESIYEYLKEEDTEDECQSFSIVVLTKEQWDSLKEQDSQGIPGEGDTIVVVVDSEGDLVDPSELSKEEKKDLSKSSEQSLNKKLENEEKIQEALGKGSINESDPTGSYGKGSGDSGRVISRPLKENSKSPAWRLDLITKLTGHVKADYDISRPNRRQLYRKLIFPAPKLELIEGVIAFDVSGSISHELYTKFAEDFESTRLLLGTCKLHLLWIDTVIHKNLVVEYGEQIDWSLGSGGGGTDFNPAFQYIENELLTEPNFLVYYTDSYGSFPPLQPNYQVIWLIWPGSYSSHRVPWGEVIKMEDDWNHL